jgi:hypothetical protein
MLALQAMGHDPAVLRGGMGARTRTAALSRLQFQPGGPPLLVVATGPKVGEVLDCLAWTPCSSPLRQVKRRPCPARRTNPPPYYGKETAEVHDYHDVGTDVLAATLAGRAPGYTSLRFPAPGAASDVRDRRSRPAHRRGCSADRAGVG